MVTSLTTPFPGYHGEYCELMYQSCTPNPCLHEGTCVESADHYRCECAPGYHGPLCQLVEVGILEGGHYAVPVPPLKYATISVKIRTRSPNGLVLYVGRYYTWYYISWFNAWGKCINVYPRDQITYTLIHFNRPKMFFHFSAKFQWDDFWSMIFGRWQKRA